MLYSIYNALGVQIIWDSNSVFKDTRLARKHNIFRTQNSQMQKARDTYISKRIDYSKRTCGTHL